MRLWVSAIGSLVFVIAASTTVGAQSSPKFTLQIGPAVVVHPEGEADHRVRPAISGVAVGGLAAIGVQLKPRWAIDIEASLERSISTVQRFSYTFVRDYTAESRDTLLTANVRWRALSNLEIFAGGGIAVSKFANRSIINTSSFPPSQTNERDIEETAHRPAFGGGIAFVLPFNARVEFIPSVDARYVVREPFNGLGASMGASRMSFQVSAALRVK